MGYDSIPQLMDEFKIQARKGLQEFHSKVCIQHFDEICILRTACGPLVACSGLHIDLG